MLEELRCAGCGAKPPPDVTTAYTLIGGRASWRLERVRSANGGIQQIWRCPTCWAAHKRGNASLPPEQQKRRR
jgi:hypothetical protein